MICPHCGADERYIQRYQTHAFCVCCGRMFQATVETEVKPITTAKEDV